MPEARQVQDAAKCSCDIFGTVVNQRGRASKVLVMFRYADVLHDRFSSSSSRTASNISPTAPAYLLFTKPRAWETRGRGRWPALACRTACVAWNFQLTVSSCIHVEMVPL